MLYQKFCFCNGDSGQERAINVAVEKLRIRHESRNSELANFLGHSVKHANALLHCAVVDDTDMNMDMDIHEITARLRRSERSSEK